MKIAFAILVCPTPPLHTGLVISRLSDLIDLVHVMASKRYVLYLRKG